MSDLILPSSYQNKVLEANLQAFFRRYPHERQRLEPLLTKPVADRAVPRLEVPPVPSKPPIRVLLLCGIGNPLFLADILNDKVFREENFLTFIVENDLDFLAFCFQFADLTQIINYKKTEWLLLQNTESIKPAMFSVLKREHFAALMQNVHTLDMDTPKSEEVSEFYKSLPNLYNETVQHVYHNFGRIDDSLEGVDATLMNKHALLNYPGIQDLKEAFRGMPALIVGAGPSLDLEIERIKANNNKFIVIAVDAALKPLVNAGIRVDYVTSIERLNDYQKPFFEDLEPVSAELIAFPVIKPDQFSVYPGAIRLVYRNYSYFAYFEKNWPKGILKCGGSTAHLAIRLADRLGCSRAYFIGLDSAYEKKEGTDLYRSHCSGTGHAEWGQYVPLDEFGKSRRHAPAIDAVNNLGNPVKTNITYYQWVKEYTEELAEVGLRMTLINCSPIGLKIEGIAFKPFSDVVEKLDEIAIEKPIQRQVLMNRHFEHKDIVQNFRGWSQMCADMSAEADAMLAEKEIDLQRFEALVFVLNFRMCIDPLFVAFCVQCCAKEFFELENEWWFFDKSWLVEQKEKITNVKKKTVLFKGVLDKLLAIFERNKGNV